MKLLPLLLMTLLLGFAACAGRPAPRDPLWDRETCAHCRMTISERRYAVQIMGPGAAVRFYDDLGCALNDRSHKPELREGRLFVRPFGGEAWVEGGAASYAANLRTPMGFGYGAVTTGGTLRLSAIEAALSQGRP